MIRPGTLTLSLRDASVFAIKTLTRIFKCETSVLRVGMASASTAERAEPAGGGEFDRNGLSKEVSYFSPAAC
jgi:hypothetical protein